VTQPHLKPRGLAHLVSCEGLREGYLGKDSGDGDCGWPGLTPRSH
jgi:hypothetical protein